jgi:ferricrocin synthase
MCDCTHKLYIFLIFVSQIYLPIEEDLPPARKVLLVEDSDAALVFTNTDHMSSFDGISALVELINVDDVCHRNAVMSQSESLSIGVYKPDAPAYRRF